LQLDDEFVEAPLRLALGHVRQHAQKLVATDSDHQIVGTHPTCKSGGHIVKQLIADAVTVLVVDRLHVVDIDERRHKASVRPPSALDLALRLLEANAAPARARELVDPGMLAVACRLLAILRGLLAITGGLLAIACRG
jgi:hypothetical protein